MNVISSNENHPLPSVYPLSFTFGFDENITNGRTDKAYYRDLYIYIYRSYIDRGTKII